MKVVFIGNEERYFLLTASLVPTFFSFFSVNPMPKTNKTEFGILKMAALWDLNPDLCFIAVVKISARPSKIAYV
jgi:hypothetical protein